MSEKHKFDSSTLPKIAIACRRESLSEKNSPCPRSRALLARKKLATDSPRSVIVPLSSTSDSRGSHDGNESPRKDFLLQTACSTDDQSPSPQPCDTSLAPIHAPNHVRNQAHVRPHRRSTPLPCSLQVVRVNKALVCEDNTEDTCHQGSIYTPTSDSEGMENPLPLSPRSPQQLGPANSPRPTASVRSGPGRRLVVPAAAASPTPSSPSALWLRGQGVVVQAPRVFEQRSAAVQALIPHTIQETQEIQKEGLGGVGIPEVLAEVA
eukprot:gene29569-35688_t